MRKTKLLLALGVGLFYLSTSSSIVAASVDSADLADFSLLKKRRITVEMELSSVRRVEMELSSVRRLDEKALLFKSFHIKGDPLVLYNAWDAGSAKAIQKGGAKAIATSSWAVAATQGYEDGEQMPFDAILANIARIVNVTNVPVTLDFEGGYADHIDELRSNVRSIIKEGVAGINFEDQVIGKKGLYPIEKQCERINAIREVASGFPVNLFINARSDVFFKSDSADHNRSHLEEAITRARAYAAAGADGFFAPGLSNREFIRELCESSPIPVNIMVNDSSSLLDLASLGVARISYGPFSYIPLMKSLEDSATKIYTKL